MTETAGTPVDVAIEFEREPARTGDSVAYELLVSNVGTEPASGVFVRNPLPRGAILKEVQPEGPACEEDQGVLTCQLGALAPGQSTIITVELDAAEAEKILVTARVGAVEPDSNLLNNEVATGDANSLVPEASDIPAASSGDAAATAAPAPTSTATPQPKPSGGCGLGGPAADMGLIGLVAIGLLGLREIRISRQIR